MKLFSNNQELFDYLNNLAAELKKRGLVDLSEQVEFAIGNASSTSTEFLGETRIALRQLLQHGSDSLTGEEHNVLREVLKQLDQVLDK